MKRTLFILFSLCISMLLFWAVTVTQASDLSCWDPKVDDIVRVHCEKSTGAIKVSEHSVVGNGAFHMHIDSITAGTTRYIVIDISDTTNYPHTETDYPHLEWIQMAVDGNATADYVISVGFLDDVDATNADSYMMKHWSGTKTAGRSFREHLVFAPNGWKMSPEFIATSDVTLNDTNYQTDVNLPSTIDPGTSDTPSGSGDMILEVVVAAGEISLSLEGGYHSH